MRRPAFTLLETVIALAIATVVMGATLTANRVIQRNASIAEAKTQQESIINHTIDELQLTQNTLQQLQVAFSTAFYGLNTLNPGPIKVAPYTTLIIPTAGRITSIIEFSSEEDSVLSNDLGQGEDGTIEAEVNGTLGGTEESVEVIGSDPILLENVKPLSQTSATLGAAPKDGGSVVTGTADGNIFAYPCGIAASGGVTCPSTGGYISYGTEGSSIVGATSVYMNILRWCTLTQPACKNRVSPASPNKASHNIFRMSDALAPANALDPEATTGAEVVVIRRDKNSDTTGMAGWFESFENSTQNSITTRRWASEVTDQRQWDFYRRSITVKLRTGAPYDAYEVTITVWPMVGGIGRPAEAISRTVVFTDF